MGILLFTVTRHFDILPVCILLNFTALVCFTSVLGFICAGLREKVPPFGIFQDFRRHIAAKRLWNPPPNAGISRAKMLP